MTHYFITEVVQRAEETLLQVIALSEDEAAEKSRLYKDMMTIRSERVGDLARKTQRLSPVERAYREIAGPQMNYVVDKGVEYWKGEVLNALPKGARNVEDILKGFGKAWIRVFW